MAVLITTGYNSVSFPNTYRKHNALHSFRIWFWQKSEIVSLTPTYDYIFVYKLKYVYRQLMTSLFKIMTHITITEKS